MTSVYVISNGKDPIRVYAYRKDAISYVKNQNKLGNYYKVILATPTSIEGRVCCVLGKYFFLRGEVC